MTYRIDKIDATARVNLKGWKITRSDGVSIQPFTTKAEAQRLIDFFGTPVEVNND